MNIFWVILIIIICVVILFFLFLFFVVWGFSQAFRNKFGPEWIPSELKIDFNHFNVNYEDKKTIKYLLSEDEANEIFLQIDNQINNKIQTNKSSFPHKFPESTWIKSNNSTYEFRQSENNKIRATFIVNTKELIYFN